MEEVRFSLFKNPINVQEGHSAAVTVEELFKLMSGDSDELGGLTGELLMKRTAEGDKKSLPYVTFSSKFADGQLRRLTSDFDHSGLFMMDIDKLSPEETDRVYNEAKSWDCSIFGFISPSGNGVKVLVKTNLSNEEIMEYGHALVNEALVDIVGKKLGAIVDPLKDSTRACFIVSTRSIFYNGGAKPISVEKGMLEIKDVHVLNDIPERDEPFETPISRSSMIMRIWKGNARRLGSLPLQSRYSWLVSFVTECHKKGIAKDALIKFMKGYVQKLPQMEGLSDYDTVDYTTTLVNKVYKAYPNEFGIHYDWFVSNSARYVYPVEEIDLANDRIGDVAAYAAEQFPEFFTHAGYLYKFNGRTFDQIDEEQDVDFLELVQAMTLRDSRANKTEFIQHFKARSQKKPANGSGALTVMLFKNGILHVDGWKFESIDPDDLVNHRFLFEFDYDYNSKANDVTWNAMVQIVLTPNIKLEKDDDWDVKEQLMYDFLGYAMFGNGQAEQVLLFTGKGANGKSSLINTIESAFPARITEAVAPSQFGDRFTGAILEGKLLNIVSDIDYSDLGHEAQFKKIVSNEIVTIEEKYKKPRKGILHCSHIFAANGDLSFKNYDAALERRFLTVLLEQVFYEEDRDYTLKDRLKSDAVKQTIINKAIEGWKRYEARGYRFIVPTSTKDAQADRVVALDHTQAFFQNCLVPEEGTTTSLPEIIEAYQEWCMEQQIPRSERVASNRFGTKVREYVQYHAPKDARIVRPKNRVHVKNMAIDKNSVVPDAINQELAEVNRMLRR